MSADWRLAVDIGGTFTDVVLLDAASGASSSTRRSPPRRPRSTASAPASAAARKAGVRPADITAPIVHATTLITNALIEGKIGRGGDRHHDGLRRHALDPQRAPLRHVRPADRVPGAAGAARSGLRDRRAHAADRSTSSSRRRRWTSRTSPSQLRDGAGRSGRRLPPQLLRQPGQRAGGRRAPRARARRAGVHLVGDLAADPRVPAHDHHRVQRRHDAGHRALPRRAAEVARRGGLRRLGADDAVQRWRGVGRRRRPGADPSGRIGPGGRRARRQLVRRAPRRGPPAVLRHGRHHGQGLPDRRRRARADQHVRGRPHLPLQEGLGLPGSVPSVDLVEIGAGGGSIARVDELGLLKVGPESAGADPGPACYGRGGTKPAVTDADLVLGLLDADVLPRRRHAARLDGRRAALRGRRRARPAAPTTPPRASTSSSTRTWRRRRGCTPSSRASTSAASRCSPSAAPVRCTPAAWPNCSSRRG